jgi:hypothetical protein
MCECQNISGGDMTDEHEGMISASPSRLSTSISE